MTDFLIGNSGPKKKDLAVNIISSENMIKLTVTPKGFQNIFESDRPVEKTVTIGGCKISSPFSIHL